MIDPLKQIKLDSLKYTMKEEKSKILPSRALMLAQMGRQKVSRDDHDHRKNLKALGNRLVHPSFFHMDSGLQKVFYLNNICIMYLLLLRSGSFHGICLHLLDKVSFRD